MITNAGFKIVSLKLTQLTVADAQAFSCCSRCKTFYGELVEYVKRTNRCYFRKKDNAVEDFRTLLIATNPAAEGTIT
jgi:nucleoside-diphosphate kinase